MCMCTFIVGVCVCVVFFERNQWESLSLGGILCECTCVSFPIFYVYLCQELRELGHLKGFILEWDVSTTTAICGPLVDMYNSRYLIKRTSYSKSNINNKLSPNDNRQCKKVPQSHPNNNLCLQRQQRLGRRAVEVTVWLLILWSEILFSVFFFLVAAAKQCQHLHVTQVL